jgi:hypothetical protein
MSGPLKFHCLKKYFKFKTESKVALYPQQHKRQICLFLLFPSPYLVESVFIWVTHAVEACNCLDVKRGDLYLSLTTLQLDVSKLASVYQAQETP